MEIINGLDFKIKKSAVTLGKFEGIHLGHRLLLQSVLEQDGLCPTVFTFDRLLTGKRIYSAREQSHILAGSGIAREVIFPFREETRSMTAEQFVEQILIRQMDTRYICVGEDFRFGKNRQGDVALLQELSGQYGYELKVCPKLKEGGEVISSSRIRRELVGGSIGEVNLLLGEPYFISGRVVHGQAVGRRIGSPTANIVPEEDKLLPAYGVYAVTVEVDGREYPGVADLGVRPTVGGDQVRLESSLFDFSGDLYEQEILVRLRAFLRPELVFDGIGPLQDQIRKDREDAARWFRKFS